MLQKLESNPLLFQNLPDSLVGEYFGRGVVFENSFDGINMQVVCVFVRDEHGINILHRILRSRPTPRVSQNLDHLVLDNQTAMSKLRDLHTIIIAKNGSSPLSRFGHSPIRGNCQCGENYLSIASIGKKLGKRATLIAETPLCCANP